MTLLLRGLRTEGKEFRKEEKSTKDTVKVLLKNCKDVLFKAKRDPTHRRKKGGKDSRKIQGGLTEEKPSGKSGN